MDEILNLVAAFRKDNPGHEIRISNASEEGYDFVLKAEMFYAGYAPAFELDSVNDLISEYEECKITVHDTYIDTIFPKQVRDDIKKQGIRLCVKV